MSHTLFYAGKYCKYPRQWLLTCRKKRELR
jgi:hypothetical protein